MSNLNPEQRRRTGAIREGLNPRFPLLRSMGQAAKGVFDTEAATWSPIGSMLPNIEVRQDVIQRGGGTGRWHVRRKTEDGEYEDLGRMDREELESLIESEKASISQSNRQVTPQGEQQEPVQGEALNREQSMIGQSQQMAEEAPPQSIIGQASEEAMKQGGQEGELIPANQRLDSQTEAMMAWQVGGVAQFDSNKGVYVDGEGNPILWDSKRNMYVNSQGQNRFRQEGQR